MTQGIAIVKEKPQNLEKTTFSAQSIINIWFCLSKFNIFHLNTRVYYSSSGGA